MPRLSLVLTVKNELASIDDLLDSIAGQTLPADEIIVVDGGSTDGTPDRLRAWSTKLPLRVIEAPDASISVGRNLALAAATGKVVAVTDGGVRLDPDWLQELAAPFARDPVCAPDVVAGFFRSDPCTLFELALAATTLPDEVEIDPTRFLPSSRSIALRRSWFRAGVRYPVWLDYCEDLIFDLRLRRAGARFEFRPSAFVWFRPRSTLRAHWHQYFRYARGDGKAGLFTRRHAIRYLTYGALAPWALRRRDRWTTIAALIGGILYMRRPWQRLWRRRSEVGLIRTMTAAGLAPPLRMVGDAAKMTGYPVGLVWRARRYGLRQSWSTIPEEQDSVADHREAATLSS